MRVPNPMPAVRWVGHVLMLLIMAVGILAGLVGKSFGLGVEVGEGIIEDAVANASRARKERLAEKPKS